MRQLVLRKNRKYGFHTELDHDGEVLLHDAGCSVQKQPQSDMALPSCYVNDEGVIHHAQGAHWAGDM